MDSVGSSVLPPDVRIVEVVRQLLGTFDVAISSRCTLRRQAEEELGLPANALDARKALIETEIDAFVVRPEDGGRPEIFWGDDRLEDAVAWAMQAHPLQVK